VVLMVVNLDAVWPQSGWTELDLEALNLRAEASFVVEDLLNGERYVWKGRRNFVALQPGTKPAHILRVQANA